MCELYTFRDEHDNLISIFEHYSVPVFMRVMAGYADNGKVKPAQSEDAEDVAELNELLTELMQSDTETKTFAWAVNDYLYNCASGLSDLDRYSMEHLLSERYLGFFHNESELAKAYVDYMLADFGSFDFLLSHIDYERLADYFKQAGEFTLIGNHAFKAYC